MACGSITWASLSMMRRPSLTVHLRYLVRRCSTERSAFRDALPDGDGVDQVTPGPGRARSQAQDLLGDGGQGHGHLLLGRDEQRDVEVLAGQGQREPDRCAFVRAEQPVVPDPGAQHVTDELRVEPGLGRHEQRLELDHQLGLVRLVEQRLDQMPRADRPAVPDLGGDQLEDGPGCLVGGGAPGADHGLERPRPGPAHASTHAAVEIADPLRSEPGRDPATR